MSIVRLPGGKDFFCFRWAAVFEILIHGGPPFSLWQEEKVI
jgi:hypothetical protein